MYNPEHQVKQYMSRDLISVGVNTSLIEINSIFKMNSFHHLPVLSDDGEPIGIISMNDIHQLEHHFTLNKWGKFDIYNKRFFETLIAKEIMKQDPICVKADEPISIALDLFLENIYHSLLVVEDKKCIGIITPQDILKVLKSSKLIA